MRRPNLLPSWHLKEIFEIISRKCQDGFMRQPSSSPFWHHGGISAG